VSNAYILTLGSLGDLYGERRVFWIGVGGSASSRCCARWREVLVAGRALEGVFGALLTPSALASAAVPREQVLER
jgi:MFS family permease